MASSHSFSDDDLCDESNLPSRRPSHQSTQTTSVHSHPPSRTTSRHSRHHSSDSEGSIVEQEKEMCALRMVRTAIRAIKDPKGATEASIRGYIRDKYKLLNPEDLHSVVRQALRMCVKNGTVERVKGASGRFKLPRANKAKNSTGPGPKHSAKGRPPLSRSSSRSLSVAPARRKPNKKGKGRPRKGPTRRGLH